MSTSRQRPARPRQVPFRTREVQKVLWGFRKSHDWRPGMIWDPFKGAYVWPDGQGRER